MKALRLFLCFLVLYAGRAHGAPEIVIDEVQITNRTPLREALIASALDLTTGAPMSREALDERLKQARTRLEALGYFKTVDLRLEKGTTRGHYRILVVLEQESAAYAGFGYNRSIFTGPFFGTFAVDDYNAFAGSRDLLGTGLQAEVSGTRRLAAYDGSFGGGEFLYSDIGTGTGFQASLLDPDIFESRWFAGGIASYTDFADEGLSSSSPGPRTESSKSSTITAQLIAGHHFGLFTTSLGVSRNKTWSRHVLEPADKFGDGSDHTFETAGTALACYSEKSYLTVVEPGAVLCAEYTRTYAPATGSPTIRTDAEYTYILGGRHALTPQALTREYWVPLLYASGTDVHQDEAYDKMYDLTLQYEYVPMDHLIFGLAYGEERPFPKGFQPYHVARHRQFSITYTSPSLLIRFALSYGEPGLGDIDPGLMARQDQKRLAQ